MASRIYADRKIVIITTFLIVGGIYLLRLLYIQVIDRSYILSANNNVLRYVTQYPSRGLVYDRNGKLLVYNEAVYDLMVIPRQVNDLDTAELCKILDITVEGFNERMKRAKDYSPVLASAFEKQITKETYGYLEEKLYRFNGFYVVPRTLRSYPMAIAAHILGYIGEVTPGQIEKNPYYRQGDYIGISGIERSYEEELRGIKGLKIRMVDVLNRDVGSFQNGKYDTAAVMGEDLYTGLDAELQQYGELLMKNKRGSVVAIEPSTGEILCFLSSPGYDPNLLVGRVRGKNFQMLNEDPVKPLLNRAIMGQYPPGSTFKMANDLIGLQEGVITPSTRFSCQGPSSYPIRCTHNHQTPLDVYTAIQQSCNPYHWQVFRAIMNDPDYGSVKERYDVWRKHLMSMGFGRKLNSDLAFELKGNLPSSDDFDKIYGKGHWNAMTIRSLSIGQGEILATPLQLVNYAAMVANGGWFYPPHVVKAIGNEKNHTTFTSKRNVVSINPEWVKVIRDGMAEVVESGTARLIKIDSIPMAGKTGTADNPHGKPHSVFIGFAPIDNPKIAICVIVENAGFGSTYAAPIASLMVEKYIARKVKRKDLEERILNYNLLYN
ncbi:MAG TPA: penicillin-binding protein 2 [Bacteroidales bacterium]|nr:penicillin-binding protein 2 [Bacteroidales bacterium]